MTLKLIPAATKAMLFIAGAALLFACGGDGDDAKDNDCTTLSNQINAKTQALSTALQGGDCEAINKAYNDLIDLYQDGDDCEAFKKAVKDAGFDNFNEFRDYLEQQRDAVLSDC